MHISSLQECAHEIAPSFQLIFKLPLDTGTLPVDWTNANISSMYKRSDKHLAENYRPVSLTSVTSKLLEHIVCQQILHHPSREEQSSNNMEAWLPVQYARAIHIYIRHVWRPLWVENVCVVRSIMFSSILYPCLVIIFITIGWAFGRAIYNSNSNFHYTLSETN